MTEFERRFREAHQWFRENDQKLSSCSLPHDFDFADAFYGVQLVGD